jgi:hypothetical protein
MELIKARCPRRFVLALLWLVFLPQTALAEPPELPARERAVEIPATYTIVRYRYHTAECRYFDNPASGIMLATIKPSLTMPTASNLISCMEPGYLQWT